MWQEERRVHAWRSGFVCIVIEMSSWWRVGRSATKITTKFHKTRATQLASIKEPIIFLIFSLIHIFRTLEGNQLEILKIHYKMPSKVLICVKTPVVMRKTIVSGVMFEISSLSIKFYILLTMLTVHFNILKLTLCLITEGISLWASYFFPPFPRRTNGYVSYKLARPL